MSNQVIDPQTLARTAVELPPQDDDDDSTFDTAGARSEAFAEDLYDDEPQHPAKPLRRSFSLRPVWVAAGAALGVSAVTASLVAVAFAQKI